MEREGERLVGVIETRGEAMGEGGGEWRVRGWKRFFLMVLDRGNGSD